MSKLKGLVSMHVESLTSNSFVSIPIILENTPSGR